MAQEQNNSIKPGVATVPSAPPVGDTSSFLQKLAMKFYSLPGTSATADKIIDVGQKVAQTRNTVVKAAGEEIKGNIQGAIGQVRFISRYGLYIVIVGAILYFLAVSGGLGALVRRK